MLLLENLRIALQSLVANPLRSLLTLVGIAVGIGAVLYVVSLGEVTQQRINDRLDPLVRVFYAPPFVDMHNRMKEALTLLGRIDRAVVRPPLKRIGNEEREGIRQALLQCGLLPARVTPERVRKVS